MRILAVWCLAVAVGVAWGDDEVKFRVVVVDQNQRPIAGATISTEYSVYQGGGGRWGLSTDRNGVLEFYGHPNTHTIKAGARGHAFAEHKIGKGNTEIVIQLRPAVEIGSSVRNVEPDAKCRAELLQVQMVDGYPSLGRASARVILEPKAVGFVDVKPGRYFVKWFCQGQAGMRQTVYPAPGDDVGQSGIEVRDQSVDTGAIDVPPVLIGRAQLRVEYSPNYRTSCGEYFYLEPIHARQGSVMQWTKAEKKGEVVCAASLELPVGEYRVLYGFNSHTNLVGRVRVESGKSVNLTTDSTATTSLTLKLEAPGISSLELEQARIQVKHEHREGVLASKVDQRALVWEFEGLSAGKNWVDLGSRFQLGRLRCADGVKLDGKIEVTLGDHTQCSAVVYRMEGRVRLKLSPELRGQRVWVGVVDELGKLRLQEFDATQKEAMEIARLPEGNLMACAFMGAEIAEGLRVVRYEQVKQLGTIVQVRNGEVVEGELRSCGR